MNYRELFNRYKNGLANEEEKHLVEQEIEKYEVVEEYLSEILDEEFDDVAKTSSFEKQEEETFKLKKSVNNRLRKVVFTSVLVVVVLYIGIFHVASSLSDSFYYNPNKITVGKIDADISFDVYAISELNMPGMSPSTVLADNKGFGEYNIIYTYTDVFTDEMYSVNEKIKRGKIVSYNGAPVGNQGMFQDIWFHNADERYIEEKKQTVINHLTDLNPVSYVSMGIVFENDLSMDELYELEMKYPDIIFEWAGIRTNSSNVEMNEVIGMQLMKSKRGSVLLSDHHIADKYPAFFILHWLVNPVGKKDDNTAMEAQAYEHHYISLLKYVVDREDAVSVLETRPDKNTFYKSAFSYAKEYGVKTYGVLVYAEARDLLEIVDDENIKGLDFNEALVSKRNIN